MPGNTKKDGGKDPLFRYKLLVAVLGVILIALMAAVITLAITKA